MEVQISRRAQLGKEEEKDWLLLLYYYYHHIYLPPISLFDETLKAFRRGRREGKQEIHSLIWEGQI